ncbi:Zinc finger CCCH domain-containing protein 3 [Apostasia shenzhenica]|uniref:Zinc finger CCCH domain-containing protein 3 n=1 Tax=Apostasia shenzhenica TaxID=1088818 RepID=A0A2I0AM92_9ASPA|nr:Zinc finger CCCH domain-containing protein 3 [Apostasia shenzhenica]
MPDKREFLNNVVSASSNVSSENHHLDDALQRLKLEDYQEQDDDHENLYPDRPGEPDCIYYMRTGSCGYGSNCRYNHPTHNGQGTRARDELPERVGQPDCQYFLKTGMCKFGSTCKYHHPRDRLDAQPVPLNVLGFPMRQDEKSCPYYMRTGTCKFGVVCKFNHPQPGTLGTVFSLTGSSAYGSMASPVAPTSSVPLVGGVSAWPLSNRPLYLSSPHIQSVPSYMPVILPSSQGTMPLQQGWTTYTGSASHVPSSDVLGPSQTPNLKNNVQPSQTSLEHLPERPDQPECQYYMKTGSCKYGSTCKYNHPRERSPMAAGTLGPLGLPLRPGQPVCSFYSMYGSCRYGSACRFDHPLVGYYNYTVSTISIPDPSTFFPSQRNTDAEWTSSDRRPLSKTTKSEANGEDEREISPARTSSPSRTAPPPESSLKNHSD